MPELLEASGYGSRPKDFDDLIRILDNEIRLITPTDPEGKEANSDSVLQTRPGQKYYQLTHDYLVHSMREWLTRKQKETRRGRAELLLADRAAVWNARPENRQLPSLLQWLHDPLVDAEKELDAAAEDDDGEGRASITRCGRVVARGGLGGRRLGAYEGQRHVESPCLTGPIAGRQHRTKFRPLCWRWIPIAAWINPLLHDAYVKAAAANDSREQLHSSLALLPVDSNSSRLPL